MSFEDDLMFLYVYVYLRFEDDNQNQIVFGSAPVLVFDQVLWEAEDGSDAYRKRKYATQTSDLPEDFVKLAEKVS